MAMATSTDRIMGVLGVMAGAILLLGLLPLSMSWTPDLFNLRLVLFGLGAMAVVVGVHRRQVHAGPMLARSAAAASLAAHALYTVLIIRAASQPGQIGPGDVGPWFFAAGLAMWLADAWFGLVTARLGAVDRWGALALALGSLLALSGMDRLGLVDGPLAAIVVPVALTGVALVGLGWVLLGIDLVRQAKAKRSSPPVHGLPSP
jgi:hypothetical protein